MRLSIASNWCSKGDAPEVGLPVGSDPVELRLGSAPTISQGPMAPLTTPQPESRESSTGGAAHPLAESAARDDLRRRCVGALLDLAFAIPIDLR